MTDEEKRDMIDEMRSLLIGSLRIELKHVPYSHQNEIEVRLLLDDDLVDYCSLDLGTTS
jgi:hypothetical protein